MDAASKGAAALQSKDFTSAITHYSRAISSNPQAVDYYIKRSTAYTRVSPSNALQALSDAEVAVVLAHNRGKRELIAQAQLRRGIALFSLERWADAEACFGWVKKLTPKEPSLGIWEKKVEGKLDSLPEGKNGKDVTVKEKPDVDLESLGGKNQKLEKEAPMNKAPIVDETKVEGVQTPAGKIRHEWYQTTETVVVTLFAKGVPKDKSTIDIQLQSLEISFPLPTGSDFNFSLEPLFSKIDPTSSTYKILSTKVEFVLKKATPAQKWSSLEGTEVLSTTDADADSSSTNHVLPKPTTSSAPAYPTSSKSGPKNWDKLASDLTRKSKPSTKKATTSTSKPPSNSNSNKPSDPSSQKPSSPPSSPPSENDNDNNNDIDDEYDSDTAGGDPVNGFFKKLFKGADPDTQRAMMKSYQESNGTALSTNWEEVGKGKVETTPPEGMVERKWGE